MRRWGLTCFWWPFIWIYSQTYRIVTNMEWETSIYILPSLQLFTFFPILVFCVYIHVNYVLNQLRVSWRHHTPLSLNAMYIFPKSEGSLIYLLFFWPCCVTCGMILVHSPGIDWTWAAVVKALNPNHWTAGKFPRCPSFSYQNKFTLVIKIREFNIGTIYLTHDSCSDGVDCTNHVFYSYIFPPVQDSIQNHSLHCWISWFFNLEDFLRLSSSSWPWNLGGSRLFYKMAIKLNLFD